MEEKEPRDLADDELEREWKYSSRRYFELFEEVYHEFQPSPGFNAAMARWQDISDWHRSICEEFRRRKAERATAETD